MHMLKRSCCWLSRLPRCLVAIYHSPREKRTAVCNEDLPGWTVNGPVTSHKGATSAKAFFSQRKREPSPVNNLGRRISVKCQCNVTSMLNWCWADICRSRLFTGRTATLEGRIVLVSGIKWVLRWRKENHSARQGDLGEVADVSHVWEGPLQATNLIFLDQQPRLHDNQEMAMKRLASLDRKL